MISGRRLAGKGRSSINWIHATRNGAGSRGATRAPWRGGGQFDRASETLKGRPNSGCLGHLPVAVWAAATDLTRENGAGLGGRATPTTQ